MKIRYVISPAKVKNSIGYMPSRLPIIPVIIGNTRINRTIDVIMPDVGLLNMELKNDASMMVAATIKSTRPRLSATLDVTVP
ncbi:hypothetical protein [Acidiplasma cupricumulans]|uniref:hypothetical protein n=1 Tax=Acidiplasma cupricumulans TaxID=312540 RepID=UPI0007811C74|nr:hypothetical protein [Acidiplasma cupricumulans]